jgi:hypothetical protein
VDDGAGVELLGGEQREAFGQIEAHLPAEDREGAGAGAVVLAVAAFRHVAHEFEVLSHGGPGLKKDPILTERVPANPPCPPGPSASGERPLC